uniref:Tr-type G domain-containing protein n=1 Tax=Ciona savignyi TaxID=51511 RepID=H2YEZ1_CIOSA
MARHRNIRNNKSYDYDDDYDVYGQSYEDDYGVSPGTIAQYSYSRSSGKDVNISSYMPSEDTVEEEVWEDDLCFESSAAAQRHRSSGSVDTSSLNPIMLDACLDHIRDAVGENYSENQMRQASAKFNCNYEKAIDFLLNSSGQPSNSKNTTSLNQNDLNVTKVAPNFTTPVKTGFVMSPNRFTQDPVNHTNGVSIGQTKLGTSSDSKTALISTPQKNKISMNANVSTPSKHNKPSFDYKVKIISAGKLYFINAEYAKREKEEKKQISLVVIGHVDAGKSTMMGHLLYQQGVVSKRLIHKYEQESKKIGKTSFAYAWVLDETGEERSRGVTMDVAHNRFETEHRIVTLMDAPGHRDFIPNMITGASEADVAVLVIGASTGEFEAGFGIGGQTREHALLVRSLGVSQLAVAVNKLDTLNWCQKRFKEILEKMRQFLKQAGFKESDVTYVPVSGLLGENLTAKATASELTSWYKGPSLIEVIDKFRAPQRPIAFPFRFCVNDVFRGQGSGITMSGKIESGGICHGTKVVVMPAAERGLIKSVDSNDGQSNSEFVLAGEHATLTLHGVDIMKVTTGSVLCDIDNPIRAVTRIQARIIVFSIEVPITRGFPVELHYKSVHEPAIIRRIISQLHRSTGEVVTKKPKFISKGHNALVEVELTRPVCLEEYSSLKELGRFTLRYGGSTIAACVVTKLLQ